jgi:GDP-4-dehydro-6-deoxy-D-mannose reductase
MKTKSKKTFLITGANGFWGSHLSSYLLQKYPDLEIVGVDREIYSSNSDIKLLEVDLANYKKVAEVINFIKPNYVIHLAGVFGSYNDTTVLNSNYTMTINLLYSLKNSSKDCIFISAGSAAEYGYVNKKHLPITEDVKAKPASDYGFAKLISTQSCLYFKKKYQLCTMVVRPFQLIGKGISDRLVVGAFTNQLIEAGHKGENIIKVGNLESSRDFLDVKDACRAISLLCENPAPGEIFNICSANPIKIVELLDCMKKQINKEIVIRTDPDKLKRQSDVSVVYGSYDKINQHCNWEPEFSLQESVEQLF